MKPTQIPSPVYPQIFGRLPRVPEPPADAIIELEPDHPLVVRAYRLRNGARHVDLVDGSEDTWITYCAFMAARSELVMLNREWKKARARLNRVMAHSSGLLASQTLVEWRRHALAMALSRWLVNELVFWNTKYWKRAHEIAAKNGVSALALDRWVKGGAL